MKGVGKVVSNAIASDLMIIIPFRNLRTLPPPVSCKSVQHVQYFCVRHITLLLAACVAPLCLVLLSFPCSYRYPVQRRTSVCRGVPACRILKSRCG